MVILESIKNEKLYKIIENGIKWCKMMQTIARMIRSESDAKKFREHTGKKGEKLVLLTNHDDFRI